MDNINSLSQSISQQIAQTPEFQELQTRIAEIRADQLVSDLFDRFRSVQNEIQETQQNGRQPSQEDLTRWQQVADEAQRSPQIASLMNAEQRINDIIVSINGTITAPLSQLYEKK